MIPGRRLTNRKTLSAEQEDVNAVTPAASDTNGTKPVIKSILRRPTLKEFEGKIISSKGARLLKSQSLDHEPRPLSPGSKTHLQPLTEDTISQKKEKKGLSRRAREVFLMPERHKDDNNGVQSEDIASKPMRFMCKFFQR